MIKKNKHFTLKAIVFIFAIMLTINANAQKERLTTAFIYQLTRLIEWCPEGKQGNFVIGVVGNEAALLNELNALQSRRVGGQQVEIRTFNSVNDITKANILFVTGSQFDFIREIGSKVSNQCTLIISDRPGSANKGAGISLVYNSRLSKLELEINRGYMKRNSLNVNDQLYNIAGKIY